MIATPRWKDLAAAGAAPQRLLWASTGVKDPTFSDVLYVEELVGPDTVDTMPVKTLDAFRDHGRVRPSLTEGLDEAKAVLASAQRSEEHTSELQSLMRISYAAFCLKKQKHIRKP